MTSITINRKICSPNVVTDTDDNIRVAYYPPSERKTAIGLCRFFRAVHPCSYPVLSDRLLGAVFHNGSIVITWTPASHFMRPWTQWQRIFTLVALWNCRKLPIPFELLELIIYRVVVCECELCPRCRGRPSDTTCIWCSDDSHLLLDYGDVVNFM